MSIRCIFLLMFIASANTQVININQKIDEWLAKLNVALRHYELTKDKVFQGIINKNISYSNGTLLGLDSLQRTDNCTLTVVSEEKKSYDVHFGLGLLALAFGNMSVNGEVMSAVLRVKENSLHVRVDVLHDVECVASLQQFAIERFEGLELWASRVDFDYLAVDDEFMRTTILTYMNELLYVKIVYNISELIQGWICGFV